MAKKQQGITVLNISEAVTLPSLPITTYFVETNATKQSEVELPQKPSLISQVAENPALLEDVDDGQTVLIVTFGENILISAATLLIYLPLQEEGVQEMLFKCTLTAQQIGDIITCWESSFKDGPFLFVQS